MDRLNAGSVDASDAAFDDRGDQFFAAAHGSSQGTIGPPLGIFLAGTAYKSIPLLPMPFRERKGIGSAAVMLASLLNA
ncbi:hypothetical protein [Paenarthrobacter aurescens]|uniref:Uncharacterized protein n=1 Tax=Paenarthrobacter aurescens TaxID=43663 RepID=A0A4Y3N7H7_PAEAU|nr:hypothetical protein [Paenarthrobacter aurescens]MDO6144527.1 hypothetical protein [Paenarthrobacter aurescens]MDO6148372.1 hypothetical protein [Paenarthrobacter aurescens]MDO6159618.1 hypothetical protein [Paenarthrobacter aurescens]MDO6164520.1 hypothetical protein [Paenarthrobacter aurescens]GEB17814.1 hypothetical protein AAU01_05690 [Paenarthrobacter aurescens]